MTGPSEASGRAEIDEASNGGRMSTGFQVTFDAANPERLGQFWAAVLGYVQQPPPTGFESWDAALDAWNVPADQRDSMYAIVDPDGEQPRLLFQKVPEGKVAKNRVHLDVNVGGGSKVPVAEQRQRIYAKRDQLIAAGATVFRESEEYGEFVIVMQDPEGNEFCLQ